MKHKTWHNKEDVPYWFWRSLVKFWGHTRQNSADFDPNSALPDCNSSLNSLMALKWCPKLNVVQKRCSIDFEGHSSNFKVTQYKIITNFDPNWAFPDCNSMFDLRWLCSLFTSLWTGTPMVAVWLAMLPSGWRLEMKAGHSDAIIHKNGWIGIMGGALGILMLSASPTNTWFR